MGETFLYPLSARKEDASDRNEIWNYEGGAICGELDKATPAEVGLYVYWGGGHFNFYSHHCR